MIETYAIIAVSIIIFIRCWRATFRWSIKDSTQFRDHVDGEDVLMACLIATVGGLLIAPYLWIHNIWLLTVDPKDNWDRAARILGGESRSDKQKRKALALEAEVARQHEIIHDYETGRI